MSLIRLKSWPPYVVGTFIGLLQLPLFLILNKSISGSGGLLVVADGILNILDIPIEQNANVAITWWSVAFLFGIIVGAFFSAKLSGRKWQSLPDFWHAFSYSLWQRCLIGFCAGVLLGIGIRFAGDSASFQEISSIAKLHYHGIITMFMVLLVAVPLCRKLYLSKEQ